MNRIDYLPLGSIVYLEGGTQKVLIVSRGLRVRNGENIVFFDYGGVPYPYGVAGDQLAYFQHEQIAKVIFEGYRDSDDDMAVRNINAYLENNPDIVRGSLENWHGAETESAE